LLCDFGLIRWPLGNLNIGGAGCNALILRNAAEPTDAATLAMTQCHSARCGVCCRCRVRGTRIRKADMNLRTALSDAMLRAVLVSMCAAAAPAPAKP
jgi:hypothetical protein